MTTNQAIDDKEIEQILDCRGDLCPLPVYKASMALKQLGVGETLKMLCTDPGSLLDIPALARQTGHELIGSLEDGGEQVFWLRKGGG